MSVDRQPPTADGQAGDWQHLEQPEQTLRYAVVAQMIKDAKPQSVLDIGCGTGILSRHLPGTEYLGIDSSEDAIRRTHGSHSREFRHADFMATDIDWKFDAVVLNESLYYMRPHREALLKALCLVSKTGSLIVSIYNLRRLRPTPNQWCDFALPFWCLLLGARIVQDVTLTNDSRTWRIYRIKQ